MSREELDPASNAEEAVSDVRTKCKSKALHHYGQNWFQTAEDFIPVFVTMARII